MEFLIHQKKGVTAELFLQGLCMCRYTVPHSPGALGKQWPTGARALTRLDCGLK